MAPRCRGGSLLTHLDDVGSAAGRAALLADPAGRVGARGEILTVGDFLSAYVMEWWLHHLDLIACLPNAEQPAAEGLIRSRETLERIAGSPFPSAFHDVDALLIALAADADVVLASVPANLLRVLTLVGLDQASPCARTPAPRPDPRGTPRAQRPSPRSAPVPPGAPRTPPPGRKTLGLHGRYRGTLPDSTRNLTHPLR